MTVLFKATPERLSAFSDGVFAILITAPPTGAAHLQGAPLALADMAELRCELSVHRDRLGKSSLPDALCHGGNPAPVVVQFRAPVFNVFASVLHCLDGGEQFGASAGCLLRGGVLPGERDLCVADLGAD